VRWMIKLAVLLLVSYVGTVGLPHVASAQQAAESFQLFYDVLSPYGIWVDYQQYGYVWMPTAVPGFRPYGTAGHWVLTDDGWTWDSDYAWGWVPFHYGRWDLDMVYGWIWVPHATWGPAWVSWRISPGYYGWAPIRPGISTSIASGRDYREHCDRWIFVRDKDIARIDIEQHYINRSRNALILHRSTVIGTTRKDNGRIATYITGPGKEDVQWLTHTMVISVPIRETDQPGRHRSNGEIETYRPRMQQPMCGGLIPVPSTVTRLRDVQPVAERTTSNQKQE
jgi:hypothetical protein